MPVAYKVSHQTHCVFSFLSKPCAQSDRIAKSSKPSNSDQPHLPQQAVVTPALQKQFPHSDAGAAVSQGRLKLNANHMAAMIATLL